MLASDDERRISRHGYAPQFDRLGSDSQCDGLSERRDANPPPHCLRRFRRVTWRFGSIDSSPPRLEAAAHAGTAERRARPRLTLRDRFHARPHLVE